jgi:hypothetical protein
MVFLIRREGEEGGEVNLVVVVGVGELLVGKDTRKQVVFSPVVAFLNLCAEMTMQSHSSMLCVRNTMYYRCAPHILPGAHLGQYTW